MIQPWIVDTRLYVQRGLKCGTKNELITVTDQLIKHSHLCPCVWAIPKPHGKLCHHHKQTRMQIHVQRGFPCLHTQPMGIGSLS